jgi:hypothetical protein
MLCKICSKLAFIFFKKKCLNCGSIINNNLSVICEECSDLKKVCSVCLKNMSLNKNKYRSCNGCGK